MAGNSRLDALPRAAAALTCMFGSYSSYPTHDSRADQNQTVLTDSQGEWPPNRAATRSPDWSVCLTPAWMASWRRCGRRAPTRGSRAAACRRLSTQHCRRCPGHDPRKAAHHRHTRAAAGAGQAGGPLPGRRAAAARRAARRAAARPPRCARHAARQRVARHDERDRPAAGHL
ncbi:MAG: hypothetical protein J3K34DRAFT_439712 [Monoraphidium minutum]|nr:MAG: hypothetical protein J3K34DRAFT_439712 [Monoraphidium minutum]